jgi:hypothetical protein
MNGDCTHEIGALPLALYLGRPDPFEPMARRVPAKRKRR